MKDEPPGNVKWGVAYRDNAVVTNLLLSNGGAHAGDLVLVLNYKVASRLRVLWKRGGVALELPPPTPL
jgi:hypothetical protein